MGLFLVKNPTREQNKSLKNTFIIYCEKETFTKTCIIFQAILMKSELFFNFCW